MSLEKINKICIAIKELDEDGLERAIEEAEQQLNYAHPLKAGTAAKHQNNGRHNLQVLTEIKELKVILDGYEQ